MAPNAKSKAKAKAAPIVPEETEETKNLKECFKRADTNGDGVIDATELGEVLRTLDSSSWTDSQVALFVKVVDTNGDGRIDYNEFAKWLSISGEAHIEKLSKPWKAEMIRLILEGLARNREERSDARWEDNHQAHPGVLGRQIIDDVLTAGGFEFKFDGKYSGKPSPSCMDCQCAKFDIAAHRMTGLVHCTGEIFPVSLSIYGVGDENPDIYAIGHPPETLQGLSWLDDLKKRLTDGLARTDVDWLDSHQRQDGFPFPGSGQSVENALKEGGFESAFDSKLSEKEQPDMTSMQILGYNIGSHKSVGLAIGTQSTYPIALLLWAYGEKKADVYGIGAKM